MIGRKKEIENLLKALKSPEPEFIVVTGRRRVGKTFLIRNTYKHQIRFEFTGIKDGNLEEQLSNFTFAMNQFFREGSKLIEKPKGWVDAFILLIEQLEDLNCQEKYVIFIDELPWLDTARSGFIKGLSFFWNSWASKNNIVLATCGSAASWMIQKLILNKGGLHNRVTRSIELLPFSLNETKLYLESKNIVLNNYQIVQLYMTIGGIPFYLKLIPKGKSVPQIISDLLFEERAPLKNEYDNLYQSLFNNYDRYTKIVEACFTKWQGITHTEIVSLTGLPSGGTLTKMIRELEVSGFIHSSDPIDNKKKETLFRLVDEFSIFYLRFAKDRKNLNWQSLSQSQGFKAWQGFAFENLCMKHILPIKVKLGVSGVNTRNYSYRSADAQIDLIIDRDDQILNLCEAKFYNDEFVISKDYANKLNRKILSLTKTIEKQKSIHLTMITSFGVKENKYSPMVQSEVELYDLFVTPR